MRKRLMIVAVVLLALALLSSCASDVKAEEKTGLERAREYISSLYYMGGERVATSEDYTLIGALNTGGWQYSIDWTADRDDGSLSFTRDGNRVNVAVDGKTSEQIDYVLTATVNDGKGNALSVSFERYIPAFKEASWNEYIALPVGSTVTVKGVISTIGVKNSGNIESYIFFQDEDGGYLAYKTQSDQIEDALLPGMTVRVTGTKDIYNGIHMIKSAAVEILDSTQKEVVPVDWTERFENAQSLSDETLLEKQSILVTIRDVEIPLEDTQDGIYYFKKGNLEGNVMLSSPLCPLSESEQDDFRKEYVSHPGWNADVTGLVFINEGAFSLIPVSPSAFLYKSLQERTDEEKISYELDNITFSGRYSEETELSLRLTGAVYKDVTLSYTSSSPFVEVDGDIINITLPMEEAEADIIVRGTCGEVESEKTYTFILEKAPDGPWIIEEMEEVSDGDTLTYSLMQENTGRRLYFTGSLSGKYLATSSRVEDAAALTIKEADDGFRMSFKGEDGEEKYIEIQLIEGKAAVAISSSSTSVWKLDSSSHVPFTVLSDGTTWYLGCYKKYETMSAISTSYLPGGSLSASALTRFAGMLVKVKAAFPSLEKIDRVDEEKTYVLALSQKNLGKDLFFRGTIDGNGLETGSYNRRVKIRVEKTDDGFRMITENGKFIEILLSGGKAVVALNDTSTSIWTLDETTGIPMTSLTDGSTYYLCSLGTYETMVAGNISDLSQDGVSRFPAYLVEDTLEEVGSTAVVDPDFSKTYVIAEERKDTGSIVFFNGKTEENGLSSSPSLEKSVNIYLESANDGFVMYFISSGEKTYINLVVSNEEVHSELGKEPVTVWKIDKDKNALYTEENSTVYYLGSGAACDAITIFLKDDIPSDSEGIPSYVMLVEKPSL